MTTQTPAHSGAAEQDRAASHESASGKTLTHADLQQFTGSTTWYRHPLNKKVLYTEGAQYVAEAGGAYWLLDEIACAQLDMPAIAAEEFQVWKLSVKADRTATLACDDGNNNVVYSKPIEFTDFPLNEISLYFTNGVILLPSEY